MCSCLHKSGLERTYEVDCRLRLLLYGTGAEIRSLFKRTTTSAAMENLVLTRKMMNGTRTHESHGEESYLSPIATCRRSLGEIAQKVHLWKSMARRWRKREMARHRTLCRYIADHSDHAVQAWVTVVVLSNPTQCMVICPRRPALVKVDRPCDGRTVVECLSEKARPSVSYDAWILKQKDGCGTRND